MNAFAEAIKLCPLKAERTDGLEITYKQQGSNVPHFTATIKVIIEADDREQVGCLIRSTMNTLKAPVLRPRLLDWGFLKTGDHQRAYPRTLPEPYVIDESLTQAEREEAFDEV